MGLTHWGRVTHICEWCIYACSAPSHYLNQCWNIVDWTLRNKLQWNFYRNSNIFIHENALKNVVCEMVSILSRPQCFDVYCSIALGLIYIWQKKYEIIYCTLKLTISYEEQTSQLTKYTPYFALTVWMHLFQVFYGKMMAKVFFGVL